MKILHLDKPIQYTNGWVEFYKLKFKVTPDVLIPRPETELLVDEVLNSIKYQGLSIKGKITVLEVGTGSGNIAISIAKNLPKARIFATDISEVALEVARENAKKHRVENRIFFMRSDLLSKVTFVPRSLQDCIIVSNLPYIPFARIPYLDPSVKDFEPRVALDGGSDGFDLYRKLFAQIREKFLDNQLSYDPLRLVAFGGPRQSRVGDEASRSTIETPMDVNVSHPKGGSRLKLIVCEIDYTQGEIAAIEAQKYFPKASVEVKTDLAKKQRLLVIKL